MCGMRRGLLLFLPGCAAASPGAMSDGSNDMVVDVGRPARDLRGADLSRPDLRAPDLRSPPSPDLRGMAAPDLSTCTPQCGGKQCGSDGCDGTCGTCPTGQTCSASGQCQSMSGECSHNPCSTGAKLSSGCDWEGDGGSCTASVCSYDSYCCQDKWDSQCEEEAQADLNCFC
jgi:hypothetical protein